MFSNTYLYYTLRNNRLIRAIQAEARVVLTKARPQLDAQVKLRKDWEHYQKAFLDDPPDPMTEEWAKEKGVLEDDVATAQQDEAVLRAKLARAKARLQEGERYQQKAIEAKGRGVC
jgi:Ni/Co efflux regulator RcnB